MAARRLRGLAAGVGPSSSAGSGRRTRGAGASRGSSRARGRGGAERAGGQAGSEGVGDCEPGGGQQEPSRARMCSDWLFWPRAQAMAGRTPDTARPFPHGPKITRQTCRRRLVDDSLQTRACRRERVDVPRAGARSAICASSTRSRPLHLRAVRTLLPTVLPTVLSTAQRAEAGEHGGASEVSGKTQPGLLDIPCDAGGCTTGRSALQGLR